MNDITLFIEVARQRGYTAQAARETIRAIRDRLGAPEMDGLPSFYIYRTDPGAGGESSSERERLVLAFASADTALAFAQHNGLGPTPRLLRLNLAQLLATLLQRPGISALLFATESDETPPRRALPPGVRIERSMLLAMLQEG